MPGNGRTDIAILRKCVISRLCLWSKRQEPIQTGLKGISLGLQGEERGNDFSNREDGEDVRACGGSYRLQKPGQGAKATSPGLGQRMLCPEALTSTTVSASFLLS